MENPVIETRLDDDNAMKYSLINKYTLISSEKQMHQYSHYDTNTYMYFQWRIHRGFV